MLAIKYIYSIYYNSTHFSITSIGANYGHRITSTSFQHSTSAEIISLYNTIICKSSVINESFHSNIQKLVSNQNRFVAVIDNNQEGCNLKYQRSRYSNKFVKVKG